MKPSFIVRGISWVSLYFISKSGEFQCQIVVLMDVSETLLFREEKECGWHTEVQFLGQIYSCLISKLH